MTVTRGATRSAREPVTLVKVVKRALIKARLHWPTVLTAGIVISLTAPPWAARKHAAK